MVHNFLYGSLSWGILWMALLLGSCKDSVEEPGFDDAYARVPQSVVMQLNVALSAPTRDVPDCEKVKELRVILLDEKTKNVEFNELMDVEFSLSYENGDYSNEMEVMEWSIGQMAKRSYLVPRMNDSEWDKLVNLAGTTNARDWVRGYEVPEASGLHTYSHVYETPIGIKYGEGQEADKNTYYLHETKFLDNVKSEDKQEYYLTLKIRRTGADTTSVLLSAKLPNLESLVRGTHVEIKAKVTRWPPPGDNSLDVRVRTWIDDPPVDGGWEEVTQGGI